MNNSNSENGWEVISTYTRAEAIEDGMQLRCPDAIREEAGIKFPVFLTTTLWDEYICPSEELENNYGQSIDGRLWDTLFMFSFAVRTGRFQGDTCFYKVIYLMPAKNTNALPIQKTIELMAQVGPLDFDNPEPAITIMLPHEY